MPKAKQESGFATEMAQFDEEFAIDQQTARRGTNVKDGAYQAQVTESRIEENNGLYAWVVVFSVPGEGTVTKWNNLDHEVGRRVAAQDSKRFGYEGKLSELDQACEREDFIGLICEIKVQTKPGDERDFVNVYINRVLGKGEMPEPGAASTDDDIPF
jgi:hypothetical protein